jgi:hypothetical protein
MAKAVKKLVLSRESVRTLSVRSNLRTGFQNSWPSDGCPPPPPSGNACPNSIPFTDSGACAGKTKLAVSGVATAACVVAISH